MLFFDVCAVCTSPSDAWREQQTSRQSPEHDGQEQGSQTTTAAAERDRGIFAGPVRGAVGALQDVLPGRGGLPAPAADVAAVLCGSARMTREMKEQLVGYGVDEARILVWDEEDEWKLDGARP